jgi:hypothetical protein
VSGYDSKNQLRNLATAVQVSIDTAVQHCEVKFSWEEGVGIPPMSISLVHEPFIVGVGICVSAHVLSFSSARIQVHARAVPVWC